MSDADMEVITTPDSPMDRIEAYCAALATAPWIVQDDVTLEDIREWIDGIRRNAETLAERLAEAEARAEKFAKAAMYGAEVIEAIPQFMGRKAVAAYQKFDDYWMRNLMADDMTFARRAVGLPEPGDLPDPNGGDAS